MGTIISLLLLLPTLVTSVVPYVWPSKSDFLEDLLVIQSGYIRMGFTDLVIPCSFGSNEVGKQTSAEWIRTAFHDFATYNKMLGTGGLDASVMFESSRPENKGAFINNTLNELLSFVTPRSSAADLIALGLVAAVASCGGPRIPYRTGRVDATQAGPSGVPEPENTLQAIQQRFANAGFNQQEMIALTACGHTVGGVHSVDFPDITGGKASASNFPKFDNTTESFDNAVVTEYLSNKTVNPLVVGRNSTRNSDKRIFSSDRNITMKSLSNLSAFRSTCASLMGRMIDSVPLNVNLSAPIEPIDIKPYITRLELNSAAAKLAFEGRIRVRTSPVTGRNADAITITLDIKDRSGKHVMVPTIRGRAKNGQSMGFFSEEFTWFEFATELNTKAGIQSFNIQMITSEASGDTKTQIFDNAATGGYRVQDRLIYSQSRSWLNTTVTKNNMTLAIFAGVASGVSGTPLLRLAHEVPQRDSVIPILQIRDVPMINAGSVAGGYTSWTVKVPLESTGWNTVFDLVLPSANGDILVEFQKTGELNTVS